jgi:hypothetical protein
MFLKVGCATNNYLRSRSMPDPSAMSDEELEYQIQMSNLRAEMDRQRLQAEDAWGTRLSAENFKRKMGVK